MLAIAIEELSHYELSAIYDPEDVRALLRTHPGLNPDQATEMVLGGHFRHYLHGLLHEAFCDGHRHILLTVDPLVAHLLISSRVNGQRLSKGIAWLDIAPLAASRDVAELNLHHPLAIGMSVTSRPPLAVLEDLENAIVARLDASLLRFVILLPRALSFAFHLRPATR